MALAEFVQRAVNVSFVAYLRCAYEAIVDRLDSATIDVAIFDANSRRSASPSAMTDSSQMMWLKCCHEYSEEWAVRIAMIVMCELVVMVPFHMDCGAERQWVIVVVLERNVIRGRYFLIDKSLRMCSQYRCDRLGSTCCQMSYCGSIDDVYALNHDNSMDYSHREHMNVFELSKKKLENFIEKCVIKCL